MILETIQAVAGAISGGEKIADKFLDEHFAQELDNEQKESMERWNNAQAINDPIARADAEWDVLVRVLEDSGTTAGGLGANTSLPTDTLAKLIEIVTLYTKEKKLNNRLIYNIQSKA